MKFKFIGIEWDLTPLIAMALIVWALLPIGLLFAIVKGSGTGIQNGARS